MKTNKRIPGGPLMLLASGALLTAFCLLQPPTVKAQWTTPDANQNINNTNSGNVGIGTTTPNALLEVKKSQSAVTNIIVDNPFTAAGNSAYSAFTLKQGGLHRLHIASVNDNHSFITPGTAQFWNFANAPTVFATNNTEQMRISSAGNVGIGTTSAGERLVTFGNFLAGNITSHTQLYSTYDSQSPVIMELGYGTATAEVTPYPSLVLSKNLTSNSNLLGLISFANSSIANGNDKRLSGIATWTDGAINNGALTFSTSLTGMLNERMRITSSGNVGIGTTNPSRKLHLATNTTQSLDGILLTSLDGHFSLTAPSLGQGSYNGITQAGDMGIIYSNGTPGTGSFVIAPWAVSGTSGLRMDSNGNVGIGTITPTFKLDVNGEVNATGLRINGTPISTGGSDAVASVFGRTGAVVAANNDYTWAQINKNTSSLADIQTRSAGDLNAGTVPIARLGVSGIPDATTFLRGDNTWAPVSSSQWTTTSGTNNISYNGGNVGIGTATPNYKVEVIGSSSRNTLALIGDGDTVGYTGIKIGALTTTNIATNRTSAFNFHMRKDNWYGGDGSGPSFIIETGSKTGGFAAPFVITPTNDIILNSGVGNSGLSYGNVGIGTTGPNYKLDVNGEINATGLRINGTPISTGGPGGPVTWAQVDKSVSSLADITTRNAGDLNVGTVPIGRIGLSGNAGVSTFLRGDNTWGPVPSSQWTSGTNNISYNAGNVGIGTASPDFLLDVFGSTNNPFRVRDSSGREYFSTSTRVGTFGTAPVVSIASDRLIIENNGPDGGDDTLVRHTVNSLVFQPSDHPDLPGAFMVRQKGGSFILHVDQNTNGNVGIGTSTPSAKLEVVGNVNVTGTGNITAAGTIEGGNIKAKYQDVAEWVESSQELPTGTLVVLDHTKSNQVIASTQAYDTRVAGVISERPGITLGESGDNKVLVATTGRVRLMVDASNGPIQIGDLLVTSDIPGVAMKSQAINLGGVQLHRPGTLIGKALEPLAKAQGKILVLLSLQ